MIASPLLRARALGRRFGARVALTGFELELPSGSTLALFGGNGAGKTTFLRLAAGLLRPTAGSIEILGADPRRAPNPARNAVGYLSHRTLLYDDLTAEENLRFFARLHGLSDPETSARHALASIGLPDRADEPVRALSRGLQQRVALARALLHRPELLLLDEPGTGLDAAATARLNADLRAAATRGAGVILATHDVAMGLAFSSRYIVLSRGRIAAMGPSATTDPAELTARLAAHP